MIRHEALLLTFIPKGILESFSTALEDFEPHLGEQI